MSVTLTNARIRTSDPARPFADTIAIDGPDIVFVGERGDWAGAHPERTLDLGGRTIVPGLIDAHAHPAAVVKSAWHIALPWTEDVDEILRFVGAYAAAHPVEEAPYLYFEYYPSTAFGDYGPTKELLDTAVADRPVLCQDFSDHAHWVNSRMLELMGVTCRTPDPLPGLEVFVRDDDGEPTGLVREGAHLHFLDAMYERIGWRPPEDVTPAGLAEVVGFYTASGVTSLFEALIEDEESVAAVAELDRRGQLPLYYEGALRFRTSGDLPDAIARVRELDGRYGGPRVRIRTLKLFLDGTNESGSGAVLAPMSGVERGHERGRTAMDVADLSACLAVCDAESVDVHIHLVGDRAFRAACDAVAAAREQRAEAGADWGIQVTLAHCELVDPADMTRPAELGITVNWTPHWSGGYFGEEARGHLGAERWNRMYRFDAIAESGACLAFGSDVVTRYELHRGAPLFGMQTAATRVDPEYPLDPARFPGSARPPVSAVLPAETLLRGYTLHAARQLRLDDRLGSLESGKIANLVVLSDDPCRVHPAAIGAVGVDAVVFEGRVVHGALESAEPVGAAADRSGSGSEEGILA